jgi:hypothetical protein
MIGKGRMTGGAIGKIPLRNKELFEGAGFL